MSRTVRRERGTTTLWVIRMRTIHCRAWADDRLGDFVVVIVVGYHYWWIRESERNARSEVAVGTQK